MEFQQILYFIFHYQIKKTHFIFKTKLMVKTFTYLLILLFRLNSNPMYITTYNNSACFDPLKNLNSFVEILKYSLLMGHIRC